MHDEEFGDIIRRLRIRAELSQQDLADRLNVSFSTVNRWENGRATPSSLAWDQVRRMVREYGTETLADNVNRVRSRIRRDPPLYTSVTLPDPLPAGVLVPGVLPGLWRGPELAFSALTEYFSGNHALNMSGEQINNGPTIRLIHREQLERAVEQAVARGLLWLTWGSASIFAEKVPQGLITDEARLHGPPPAVAATDILPDALPAAWTREVATVLSIWIALSEQAEIPLPWLTVRTAVDAALLLGLVETVEGPDELPVNASRARDVTVRQR